MSFSPLYCWSIGLLVCWLISSCQYVCSRSKWASASQATLSSSATSTQLHQCPLKRSRTITQHQSAISDASSLYQLPPNTKLWSDTAQHVSKASSTSIAMCENESPVRLRMRSSESRYGAFSNEAAQTQRQRAMLCAPVLCSQEHTDASPAHSSLARSSSNVWKSWTLSSIRRNYDELAREAQTVVDRLGRTPCEDIVGRLVLTKACVDDTCLHCTLRGGWRKGAGLVNRHSSTCI